MDGIATAAREVLDRNWREGEAAGLPFAYTRPDVQKYPAQFFWDSCFHALAWAELEPRRGREELRSLLRVQEADGFIGHTIFWDAPIRLSRRAFYNVLHAGDRMTRTIQPPFLALAWEAVATRSADEPAFATEALAGLRAYYDWLARERDREGSGLLTIVQPDECGLDASPKFDRLLGLRAAGYPGFVALVQRNRRDRFLVEPIARRGGFAVREVLVNVAYALSLEALARLGGGEIYAARAARARHALLEQCLDAETGLFFDLAGDDRLAVSTFTSIAPLALPGLPRVVVERLVDEHVANPQRYWLPYPIPSTAADEPAFRPRTRLLRYWRGPTWMPCAWIVHRGLLAHGFDGLAAELAGRVVELVRRSGLREYYDPYSGQPMGAAHFGMSTLATVIAAAHPGLGD